MRSFLIYGMGMMGASLAYAIRQSFPGARICGVVRSRQSQQKVEALALADLVLLEAGFSKNSIEDFDLVISCIPILKELEFFQELRSGALFTNISSTAATARTLYERLDLRFVAAHPMCGSDLSGPGAFIKDLYTGRLCFIIKKPLQTGAADPPEGAVQVENFWKKIGMKTYWIAADDHDLLLAYVSHGPHLLSSLLARWALPARKLADDAPLPVTGGGFKDMARIAGSNPEMWHSILACNRENIRKALSDFQLQLEQMIKDLDKDAAYWTEFQQAARRARDELYG